MSKETGLLLTPEEALYQQIVERSTPRESTGEELEHKIPPFARGRAHKVFDKMNLYRPPVGFDQDIIPRGLQPQIQTHYELTQAFISFAHPDIVETRKDRDIVQEVIDHKENGGTTVVVAGHLSHDDGPKITKVLEDQGIHDTVSILGLRIIRNPFANLIRQGVRSIPVYPASEYFWKEENFENIKDMLSQQAMEYVRREQELAQDMNLAAKNAIIDVHKQKDPILVFLEGSRHPKEGLQKPISSASGIIKRGGPNVKVLVMSLMGTENMLPKGKGPRIAEVTTRFVDLLDPNAIIKKYQEAHPKAKFDEINEYLLDEIMVTIAHGLEPKYRGIYAGKVDKPFEFVRQPVPGKKDDSSMIEVFKEIPRHLRRSLKS